MPLTLCGPTTSFEVTNWVSVRSPASRDRDKQAGEEKVWLPLCPRQSSPRQHPAPPATTGQAKGASFETKAHQMNISEPQRTGHPRDLP